MGYEEEVFMALGKDTQNNLWRSIAKGIFLRSHREIKKKHLWIWVRILKQLIEIHNKGELFEKCL